MRASVCSHCGGRLKRVHRTPLQKLVYAGVYQCSGCGAEAFDTRFIYHRGPTAECPHCGTATLSKLPRRDRIDAMRKGVWNLIQRAGGGQLFHCNLCRLQFYDRRPMKERPEERPGTDRSNPAAGRPMTPAGSAETLESPSRPFNPR
jgi:DNA-directed RNA polymerase subunit RPC12/RpoP